MHKDSLAVWQYFCKSKKFFSDFSSIRNIVLLVHSIELFVSKITKVGTNGLSMNTNRFLSGEYKLSLHAILTLAVKVLLTQSSLINVYENGVSVFVVLEGQDGKIDPLTWKWGLRKKTLKVVEVMPSLQRCCQRFA